MKTKYKIIITDLAKTDIIAVTKYIALDNLQAAANFTVIIKSYFSKLSLFPHIGKSKPEINDKSILVLHIKWNYSIIYKIEGYSIIILRVLTSYQDLLGNI